MRKEIIEADILKEGKKAIEPYTGQYTDDIITAKVGIRYVGKEDNTKMRFFIGRVIRFPAGFFIPPYYDVVELKEVGMDDYIDFGVSIEKGEK